MGGHLIKPATFTLCNMVYASLLVCWNVFHFTFPSRKPSVMEVPNLPESKRIKDSPQCLEVLHKIIYEFYTWQMLMLEAIVNPLIQVQSIECIVSLAAWLQYLPSSLYRPLLIP